MLCIKDLIIFEKEYVMQLAAFKFLDKTEYNGKEIMIVRFSKAKSTEEMLEALEEIANVMKASDKKLLTLADANGITVGNKFMKRSQELSKEVFEEKREKGAIIGISGMKALMLKAYNLFSKDKLVPFSTEEAALEYLVK